MGIRKIIYGILQLGAESTATTQATAVIQSTSGSLALVPSGSGAITAAIPDGTTTGGNARGTNSVDLQMSRSSANEVASGVLSTIAGGTANRASGNYSTIVGGAGCTASGQYSVSGGLGANVSNYAGVCFGNANTNGSYGGVVSGGQNNTGGSSDYVVIGGGRSNNTTGSTYGTISGGSSNTASSNFSTISGGQSNTASTNTHATVVGGNGNISSGQNSISGGGGNTASGIRSVCFGRGSVASGADSVSLGEYISTTAQYGFGIGSDAKSYLRGQFVSATSVFAANGDAQQSLLTTRKQDTLTTGATSSLSLDGTGTTNLIIPNGSNRAWNTTVNWVATVTGSSGTTTGVTVGNSIYGVSEFGFKVSASIASITPLIRDSIVADTTIMETATLTYATGSSNSLAMTFTAPTFAGGGSLGMRVVAKVSLVELAW